MKVCLLTFLFICLAETSFCQDTIVKVIVNKEQVPFAHRPPNTAYWKGVSDTVYATRYLAIDTVLSMKYSLLTSDTWATFYNDGTLMELGNFKKYRSRLNRNRDHLTMVKYGKWLYFNRKGKLIRSSVHKGDLSDD